MAKKDIEIYLGDSYKNHIVVKEKPKNASLYQRTKALTIFNEYINKDKQILYVMANDGYKIV